MKNNFHKIQINKRRLFLSIFVVLGILTIISTRAAINITSFEAETAAINGPLTTLNDQSASGGQFIRFGSSPFLSGVNVAGAEFNDAAIPGTHNVDYRHTTSQAAWKQVNNRLGPNAIARYPFLWERLQRNLGGSLDTNEAALITSALDAANNAGVKVILDVHNYGRYNGAPINGSGGPTTAQFTDFWKKVVNKWGSHPAVLGWGIMNEPHDMPASPSWEQVSQAAVDAIRSAESSRKTILVPLDGWSGAQRAHANHPSGPWIIDASGGEIRYEAHHYWDRHNVGNYPYSYADEVENAKSRGWTANGNKDALHTRIRAEIAHFWDWLDGEKGFIGEAGWPWNTDSQNWNDLADVWLADSANAGFWVTQWAAGEWWGTYNLGIYVDDGLSTVRPNNLPLESL